VPAIFAVAGPFGHSSDVCWQGWHGDFVFADIGRLGHLAIGGYHPVSGRGVYRCGWECCQVEQLIILKGNRMKWALLGLACVSLLLCYLVGAMAVEVNAGQGSVERLTAIETSAASTYFGGAIGAGLIGAAASLGAALIQVSENKKKD